MSAGDGLAEMYIFDSVPFSIVVLSLKGQQHRFIIDSVQ